MKSSGQKRAPGARAIKRIVLILPIVAALVFEFGLGGVTPASAGKPGGTTGCSKRNPCDTTPPSASINTPTSGSTVSGSVSVAGSASDNVAVSKVELQVDGGAFALASGTTTWTFSLTSSSYSDGTHSLTARVSDAAGNSTTKSQSIVVSNAAPPTGSETVGANILPTGRGKMASSGSLTFLLYQPSSGYLPSLYVRDSQSATSSKFAMPNDSLGGNSWFQATYFVRDGEFWVFSGAGPLYVRRYQLTGSPLPTGATLVSTSTFGTSDSRAEQMISLASGGLVAVWHQQGSTGPQGQGVAYRSSTGNWSTLYPINFMPTKAAVQTVAQNPVDGSIWVFCDADAWGAIGVMHLTESGGGVSVDWTDGTFIRDQTPGQVGPDPENPHLEAVADPVTGTVALAYQSEQRKMFSTSPVVTGSYPAIARIAADRSISYTMLSVYIERVSPFGLVLQGSDTWLTYTPIQPDLTYQDVYAQKYSAGVWSDQIHLGTRMNSYIVGFGDGRSEFADRLTDGALHFFAE